MGSIGTGPVCHPPSVCLRHVLGQFTLGCTGVVADAATERSLKLLQLPVPFGALGTRNLIRVSPSYKTGSNASSSSRCCLKLSSFSTSLPFLIKDKCSTAVFILTIKEGCRMCAELYLKLQHSVGFLGYVNVRLRCKTGGLQERAYLEGP